jgi:GNAT superfamily N-acetyltransferase
MSSGRGEVLVRVAAVADIAAIASLRSLWLAGEDSGQTELARRIAAWLAEEGDRRTTWLALSGDQPLGMTSLFEYRRMPRPDRPDSRWGYVSNMFVRQEWRGRGIGAMLLGALTATADKRSYARLVVSPSAEGLALYRRAGFLAAGEPGADVLFVRPGRP